MIQAKITFNQNDDNRDWDYKTSLNHWLNKELEFNNIEKAEFNKEMTLATVGFGKDHIIYILVPKDIFI